MEPSTTPRSLALLTTLLVCALAPAAVAAQRNARALRDPTPLRVIAGEAAGDDDQEVEGICIALEHEPDDDLAATVTMDYADMGLGAQTWGVSTTDEVRDLGRVTPRSAPSWSAAVESDPAFGLIVDRPPRRLSIELGGG